MHVLLCIIMYVSVTVYRQILKICFMYALRVNLAKSTAGDKHQATGGARSCVMVDGGVRQGREE